MCESYSHARPDELERAPFVGIPLNDTEELAGLLDASVGPARWLTPMPFTAVTYRFSQANPPRAHER